MQSVGETVGWHLRRLKGVDIYDEVLFITQDGATERGVVLEHEMDIQNSEDGTVSIGGNCRIRRVPIKSIMRVTARRADKIRKPAGRAVETDVAGEDFYADASGVVRRRFGEAFRGGRVASGGEMTGGLREASGSRRRSGVNGQISGRDGNVVYARFGKAK